MILNCHTIFLKKKKAILSELKLKAWDHVSKFHHMQQEEKIK